MTWEPLSRDLFFAVRLYSVLHVHAVDRRRKTSQCYHVVHKIMRSFMKYASKSCKGSTVKAKFAAYFKEITFLLRYALGMRQRLNGATETIC